MREIRGIDVSGYNLISDYQAVKNDGAEFAILKIMRKDCHVDKGFERHLKGFQSVGVRVSDVYTYSYATTIAQAESYAKQVLALLNKYNMPKSTVVWLDIEDKCQQGLGRSLIDIINKYVDVISADGYVCGLYTGFSFYLSFIKPYAQSLKIPLSATWIARYYNSYKPMKLMDKLNEKFKPFANEKIAGWQFTSTGVVNGIKKQVDCNVVYINDGVDIDEPKINSKSTITTYEGYVNTNGSRLNVRNSKGVIVGKLNNKTKVTVYGKVGDKFRIGTDKYVACNYVTVKGAM